MTRTDVDRAASTRRASTRMVVAALATGVVLGLLRHFLYDSTVARSVVTGATATALMIVVHVVDQRWERRRRTR
ncbi:hypothetical protein [Kineococcus sp. G2]|uniref:hypothetical protein n=1 Tax=Kineococcus sp. G2 TaxID=3127484 RepID=UPI00301C31EB